MSVEESKAQDGIPLLDKTNWTVWKFALKKYAFDLGSIEVVDSLTEEVEIDHTLPTFNDRLADGSRKYTNDTLGQNQYREDRADMSKIRIGKTKLIGKMLSRLDKIIEDELLCHPQFAKLEKDKAMVGMYQLIGSIAGGSGSAQSIAKVLKLVNLKQTDGDLFKHTKELRESIADVDKLDPDPRKILDKIYSALTVLSVDQNIFQQKLRDTFAKPDWPAYNVFLEEVENEYRNRSTISKLQDREEGLIVNRAEALAMECWNCGGNHRSNTCPKPRTKCGKCGMSGHLKKYHEAVERVRQNRKPAAEESTPNSNTSSISSKSTTKSNKSTSRAKILKHASALIASLAESEGVTMDQPVAGKVSAEEEEEEEEEESEDEAYAQAGFVYAMEGAESSDTIEVHMSTAGEPLVNCDTGCIGASVFKPEMESLLKDIKTGGRKIYGVNGGSTPLQPSKQGKLANFGPALITADAADNLLSVLEVCKSTDGKFVGDKQKIDFFDSGRNHMFRAHNDGTGWKVPASVLKTASLEYGVQAYTQTIVHPPEDSSSEDGDDPPPPPAPPPAQDPRRLAEGHFTPEQRRRAKEVDDLHVLLGHAHPDAMRRDLASNAYHNLNLTANDVDAWLHLYGKCDVCLEAAMIADPDNKRSPFPPPIRVGEHLHIDPKKLTDTKSFGGITQELYCVDGVGDILHCVGMKNKSTASIKEALTHILGTYNRYGHKVDRISSDHESNLLALRDWLSTEYGITYTPLPAGLHERKVERSIQEHGKATRKIENNLQYEVPAVLEHSKHLAAADALLRTSTKKTTPFTPHQLLTGGPVVVPQHYFGEIGIVHRTINEKPVREKGVYISHGEGVSRSHRVYLPMRAGIYSVRKFVKTTDQKPPAEWNFKPRLQRPTPKTRPAPLPSTAPIPLHPLLQPRSVSTAQGGDIAQEGDLGATLGVNQRIQPRGLPTPPPRVLPDTIAVVPPPALSPIRPVQPAQSAPPVQPVLSPPYRYQEGEMHTPPRGSRQDGAQPAPRPQTPAVSPTHPMRTRSQGLQPPMSIPTPKTVRPQPVDEPFVLPQGDTTTTTRQLRDRASYLSGKDGTRIFRNSSKYSRAYRAHCKQIINDPHGPLKVLAYRISIRSALMDKTRRASAKQAVDDEIRNIEESSTFEFVQYDDIDPEDRPNIIPMFMFLKDKFKADGSFDKTKGRLCVEGNHQNPDLVGDTFSPTVNPISVFTQLQITVKEALLLSSYDVKGAFLTTPMEEGKVVYCRIPRDVVSHWIQLYPERAQYVHDGYIYVSLNKYMYGLRESPGAFNRNLDSVLKDMGFKALAADTCMYVKTMDTGRMIVSTHVDDLLVSSPSAKCRKWFEDELRKVNFDITSQYENISYLGMQIEYQKQEAVIKVSQIGYAKDIVDKNLRGLRKPPPTPCVEDIVGEHIDSPRTDKHAYLSAVMSIMYLARLTRPDLLFAVTTLATKCADPREIDMQNLNRLIRYLAGTINRGYTFRGDADMMARAYADASHGLHSDGRGHGAIAITLGSAPVMTRCFKLKPTTRSSSESELYVLDETSTYCGWFKLLLRGLGYRDPKPVQIYQDNKSTIIMAMEGGHFKRTKHLLIRESFIKEQLDQGFCELKYLKSADMPVDMMTKPMSSVQINRHAEFLDLREVKK